MKTGAFLIAVAAAALAETTLGQTPAPDAAPTIGVYYFPGWQSVSWHYSPYAQDPWAPIKAFPEREPQLGWYQGDSRAIVQQQADWMHQHHIGFMVYDWPYEHGIPQLQGPLLAYRALTTPRPPFALLWTNHGSHTSVADWKTLVRLWTTDYLRDPNAFRIDGRPALFIFSAQRLADDAAAAGANVKQWLADAQAAAAAAGLPPIYFVAGVSDGYEPIVHDAKADGFAAVSGYDLRHGPSKTGDAHGYVALDQVYRSQWTVMSRFAPSLPAILPITSGWDHRPWGPSPDPLRDRSIATPAQFASQLAAARQLMEAKGLRYGVICCWNEYGEGNFIEPTKATGAADLNAVMRMF